MHLPILRRVKAHAPCPGCGLHNDLESTQCKHCGRTFNEIDQQEINQYAEQQRKKGTQLGIFVVSALLLAALTAGLLGD